MQYKSTEAVGRVQELYNLTIIFFAGLYYHISKRAAGIRYVFIGKPSNQRPRYGDIYWNWITRAPEFDCFFLGLYVLSFLPFPDPHLVRVEGRGGRSIISFCDCT